MPSEARLAITPGAASLYEDTCRAAIGHMLVVPDDAPAIAALIEPRHFLNPVLRSARIAVSTVLASGGVVGPHSVAAEMIATDGADWAAVNLELAECMGASTHFRSRDAAHLIRAHVAGAAMHAALVKASDRPVTIDLLRELEGLARDTERELAPRGDLAAFLDQVKTGTELLLSDEPTPESLFGEHLICAGSLVGIVGPPKQGKTILAVDLLHAAATTTPWLGFEPDFMPADHTGLGLKVGLLEMEMSAGEMKKRLANMTAPGAMFAEQLDVLCMPRRAVDLTREADQRVIENWIRARRLGMVVIDSASKVSGLSSGRQEKDAADMMAWVTPLAHCAKRTGACIVVLFHTPKRQGDNREAKDARDVVESIRGSGAAAADLDTVILIEPTPSGGRTLKFACRHCPEPDTVHMRLNDRSSFERTASPAEQRTSQQDQVLLMLSQSGTRGLERSQVCANLSVSEATAKRLLTACGAVKMGTFKHARWVHPDTARAMDHAQSDLTAQGAERYVSGK